MGDASPTLNQRGPASASDDGGRSESFGGQSLPEPASFPTSRATASLKSAADDTLRAIDLEERATDAARMRLVAAVALVLWSASLVVDAILARTVLEASVTPFVVLRVLAALPLVVLILLLGMRSLRAPSVAALQAFAFLAFVPPIVSLALLAIRHPALAPLFGHGAITVIVVVAMSVPSPWKRALPLVAGVATAYGATLAIATTLDPVVRMRMSNPEERALFVQILDGQLIAAALTLMGGHLHWAMRRAALVEQHRGRYKLEKLLGSGGMGEVWRAWHPALARHVAIKILRQSRDEELVQRFTREAKATARLLHPNTVRVLDCGLTDDGLWYYTMELLHGRTLAQLVEREGALSPARAVFLVSQAARALAEAHVRGLVHRDVKPENIFVTAMGGETDFVKVLDFGIARLVHDERALTCEGVVIGTPRFMAPEQERGLAADARSDVYGLGATLYFALTGEPPLKQATLAEIAAARERGELVAPSHKIDGIPPVLDDIVMRCLSSDRGLRYADADQLARALADTGLARQHVPPPFPPEFDHDDVDVAHMPYSTRKLSTAENEPVTKSERRALLVGGGA